MHPDQRERTQTDGHMEDGLGIQEFRPVEYGSGSSQTERVCFIRRKIEAAFRTQGNQDLRCCSGLPHRVRRIGNRCVDDPAVCRPAGIIDGDI